MFKVFPGWITPQGRKVPLFDGWNELATTDPQVLEAWTRQWRSMTHWAAPTGAVNGILVLDIDVKGGGTEHIKHYPIPDTLAQQTQSGGVHYIFKLPMDGFHYGNKVALGGMKGVDIRGHRGYIFLYNNWNNKPILDAPPWLLDLIKNDNKVKSEGTTFKIPLEIAQASFQGILKSLSLAGEGERNNVLNVEAFKAGQLIISSPLDENIVITELSRVAAEIGLEKNEIKATVKSGIKSGKLSPMTCPFPNTPPVLDIVPEPPKNPDEEVPWTPRNFTREDLFNFSKLKKPQLFKDWSSEDIQVTTADGGTGKTTLELYEAVCLALGEPFLGFQCLGPGKTLYITGEDSAEKYAAILGAMIKQMGIADDAVKVETILSSIIVKKDSDLCVISKTRDGFLSHNKEALARISTAIDQIKPRQIIFDPISMFWGSESALNDMNKAVSKFMGAIQERSNAAIKMINHMGKDSSRSKDMSQFAGRGGTGLPSHSRISKVLRAVDAEEYKSLTGTDLLDGESAIICNIGKFSDGSPLTSKPFVIVRKGYLFSRKEITEASKTELDKGAEDISSVFNFVKETRNAGKYATKPITIAHFKLLAQTKIPESRVKRALEILEFVGFDGEWLKAVENPDLTVKDKVYIVTNSEGREV